MEMRDLKLGLCAAAAAAGLVVSPAAALGQGGGVSTPLGLLHEFLFVQLIPDSRDEFIKFLRDEYVPLQRLDPNLKSINYYVEDKGTEWDLIVDMTYADYAGAGASQKRFAEDFAKRYATQAAREAFMTKFHAAVVRHQHLFYRELPALARQQK